MLVNMILIVTAVTGLLVRLSFAPLRQKYANIDPRASRSRQHKKEADQASEIWVLGGFLFVLWIAVGLFVTYLLSVDLYVYSDFQGRAIQYFFVLSAPLIALSYNDESIQSAWVVKVVWFTVRAIPIALAVIFLVTIHGTLNWYERGYFAYWHDRFGVFFEVLYIAAVLAMLATLILSANKVRRLYGVVAAHDAEQAERGPLHDTGCWLCGSPECKTFGTEYGWYGESTLDTSTSNFTNKSTTSHYLRIGETAVDLCTPCIAAQLKYRRDMWAPIIRNAFIAATLVFLPNAFLLDWFSVFGLPENSIDFLYRSRGPTIFGILLSLFTFVALIAVFILGILSLPIMRRSTASDGGEADPADAEDLAWELAVHSIEKEHEGVDPHYFFYPNAPLVEYGSINNSDGAVETYEKRYRHTAVGQGWNTTDYWIAPREAYVSNWESKPLEPRREVYSYPGSIRPDR
jgi:hypothetical protein